MLDLDESLLHGRIPLLLELRLLSVIDPKASIVFRDPSMHVKDVPWRVYLKRSPVTSNIGITNPNASWMMLRVVWMWKLLLTMPFRRRTRMVLDIWS